MILLAPVNVFTDSNSTTFAIAYGLSFAAIASLVVYTYLHHGKTIWRQYKSSTTEKPDIHMKLMRRYKEAPTWWYMSLFAVVGRTLPTESLGVSDCCRCSPSAS